MLKKWELSYAPTEKDRTRWRLKLRVPEENLDALLAELPGNKGRPFLVEDGQYDFGVYFYNLSEDDHKTIKSILEKKSPDGKSDTYSATPDKDIFSELAQTIEQVSSSSQKDTGKKKKAELHDDDEPAAATSAGLATPGHIPAANGDKVKNHNGSPAAATHSDELSGSRDYFIEDIPLNPDYTFEQFVVGPNNRFTHAAALAVAKAPGKTYNPFFIHGGVGLGKTHLMQSIGHYVRKTYPELKVVYITTEKFVADVIDAISRGEGNALRNFYKTVDVLLVDDIQSLAQSESTQEEFFHIFNLLHQNKKQIVITCDRPPKLLNILEDRLRSRFEWGLIADIKSPSIETRVAILKKKEEMEKLSLDDNILLYIASKLKSNIRELEGFLKRITAYSTLTKQEVDITLVKQLMAELLPAEENPTITLAQQEEQLKKKSSVVADMPLQTIPREEISLPEIPTEETARIKPDDIKESDIRILPKGAVLPSAPPHAASKTSSAVTAHFTASGAAIPSAHSGEKTDNVATAGARPSSYGSHPPSTQALDPTLKPVDAVFFFPSGHEKELAKVKEKFAEVIKKHKLKFQLVSIFDKPYETEGKINYAMFTELCKTNKVSLSVVLAPPPGSGLKEDEFANILGAMMSDEKISMQLVPWNEINKDYRYLNLALDITLSTVDMNVTGQTAGGKTAAS